MTSGTRERKDDEFIAAEYVLGVLPHAERTEFAQRLLVDQELKSRVDYWGGKFSPLLDDVVPVAPPVWLLSSLERRLFPDTATAPAPWLGLRFWQSLTAALFAALVALTTAYFSDWRPGGTVKGAYVAELNGDAGRIKLVTFYDPRTGTLRFNRLSPDPVPGRSFELWLLAGKNAPVSLGLLPADVSGSLILPNALRKAAEDAVLAVSDEPSGGSPTGQPTGAILAAAKLNSV